MVGAPTLRGSEEKGSTVWGKRSGGVPVCVFLRGVGNGRLGAGCPAVLHHGSARVCVCVCRPPLGGFWGLWKEVYNNEGGAERPKPQHPATWSVKKRNNTTPVAGQARRAAFLWERERRPWRGARNQKVFFGPRQDWTCGGSPASSEEAGRGGGFAPIRNRG